MVFSEIDCSLRGSWLDQNDNVPKVLKRISISLCCAIVSCQTSLRNGSASDSRSEGCLLKSGRGQARILIQLVSYSCCRVSLMNPRTCLTMTFCKHTNHTYTINLLNLIPINQPGRTFFPNLFIRTQNNILQISHLNANSLLKI